VRFAGKEGGGPAWCTSSVSRALHCSSEHKGEDMSKSLQQHKAAIEAAVRTAEAEGFLVEMESSCTACQCSGPYEATLTHYVPQETGGLIGTESTDLDL
jgi:hypothetical protein